MSTIYNADIYQLRRKIGGAFGALGLMVGALAVAASVAAPTASAMKNECRAHFDAYDSAVQLGMTDWANVEWAAAVDCANRTGW